MLCSLEVHECGQNGDLDPLSISQARWYVVVTPVHASNCSRHFLVSCLATRSTSSSCGDAAQGTALDSASFLQAASAAGGLNQAEPDCSLLGWAPRAAYIHQSAVVMLASSMLPGVRVSRDELGAQDSVLGSGIGGLTLRKRPSTGAVSSLLAGPWSLLLGEATCSASAGTLTCSTPHWTKMKLHIPPFNFRV